MSLPRINRVWVTDDYHGSPSLRLGCPESYSVLLPEQAVIQYHEDFVKNGSDGRDALQRRYWVNVGDGWRPAEIKATWQVQVDSRAEVEK